jgi:predicted metal-dependent hydrolase
MIPNGTVEEKKHALITLYRELAQAIIVKRISLYSEKSQQKPEKVQINSATTRWGSCSGRKTLSFSWKLIQLPLDVVDYVVVHELSHLQEMNHSPAFWAVVRAIMPDYLLRRKKLRKLARTLPHW